MSLFRYSLSSKFANTFLKIPNKPILMTPQRKEMYIKELINFKRKLENVIQKESLNRHNTDLHFIKQDEDLVNYYISYISHDDIDMNDVNSYRVETFRDSFGNPGFVNIIDIKQNPYVNKSS